MAAGARGGQHVDHARRHPGLGEDPGERVGGQRRLRRGLHARRCSRRRAPAPPCAPHRRGEVPRRHHHRDADRLVLHQDPVGPARSDREIAVQPHRLLGEPAEELGGIGHLPRRVRQRLAVLERDQLGQHVLALEHQLEAAPQHLRPLARRGRRPAGKGGIGRRHRVHRILDRGIRDAGDHRPGRRVEYVDPLAARPRPPLPADPEIRAQRLGVEAQRGLGSGEDGHGRGSSGESFRITIGQRHRSRNRPGRSIVWRAAPPALTTCIGRTLHALCMPCASYLLILSPRGTLPRRLPPRLNRPCMPPSTSADFKERARRRVPKMFFDYADSGAWTESTYRANEADFAKIKLRQRVLVDMTDRSLASDDDRPDGGDAGGAGADRPHRHAARRRRDAGGAGGRGLRRALHALDHEHLLDRGRRCGDDASPSGSSSTSCATATSSTNLIDRAKAAGCSALVLTLDLQILGQRHKDLRNGLSAPPKFTPKHIWQMATRPFWCLRHARHPSGAASATSSATPRTSSTSPRSPPGPTSSSTRGCPGTTSPGSRSAGAAS